MNSLLTSEGQEWLSASRKVINTQKYLLRCLLVGEWLRLMELLLKKRQLFQMTLSKSFFSYAEVYDKFVILEQLCNKQRFFMPIAP